MMEAFDENKEEYFTNSSIGVGYSDGNSSVQDMEMYLNVTEELPIQYAVPMYGYVMPFLLLITIIANTLIVVSIFKIFFTI